MTREAMYPGESTPFGLFMREHCRSSKLGLCITNLDYVIEEYRWKKMMLIEEKSRAGGLGSGQEKTFEVLDSVLRIGLSQIGYEYWGFFILRFPAEKSFPGPGMTLNGKPITVEQLVRHINFEEKFCEDRFGSRNSDLLEFGGG